MKTENVLYTDGHDVTVTDSMLQVKKKWYHLSGISKHNFKILQPDRLPAVLLLISGAMLEVIGALHIVPSRLVPTVRVFNLPVTASMMLIAVGIIFLLVGAVWMWLTKERYAVNITTAEGEKDVVVSERKEYITQIIHALNEAFFARLTGPNKESKKQNFIVSGR
jgi:hypothetical protein